MSTSARPDTGTRRCTATALRAAGRQVPTPCELALECGAGLSIEHWLRVLPGKRLTGVGRWQNRPVLAKLFIAARGDERHWQRECQGAQRLQASSLPTPALLASGRLVDGGHYVLYEYLAAAHSPTATAANELTHVFNQLGRLHAAGLLQEDAHLDNFLLRGAEVFIIDGDAVRPLRNAQESTDNLALLFAQLPLQRAMHGTAGTTGTTGVSGANWHEHLLASYRAGNPHAHIDAVRLAAASEHARAARLADYLGKCLRDCSLFTVVKSATRFSVMPRDEAEFLAPLIAAPDRWIENGRPLKQGRTATLAQVEHAGRQLVIKRYNIKHVGHALSRCWRPSRAWHSWIEGNRLRFLGIATPRPLALIEHRLGPLRGRAWLITDYCPGPSLAEMLPNETQIGRIGELFRHIVAARISHGDLKASNLLWNDDGPLLIDLDAMQQHAREAGFRRAWRKDRARFLRNWPAASAVHTGLAAALPAA